MRGLCTTCVMRVVLDSLLDGPFPYPRAVAGHAAETVIIHCMTTCCILWDR